MHGVVISINILRHKAFLDMLKGLCLMKDDGVLEVVPLLSESFFHKAGSYSHGCYSHVDTLNNHSFTALLSTVRSSILVSSFHVKIGKTKAKN